MPLAVQAVTAGRLEQVAGARAVAGDTAGDAQLLQRHVPCRSGRAPWPARRRRTPRPPSGGRWACGRSSPSGLGAARRGVRRGPGGWRRCCRGCLRRCAGGGHGSSQSTGRWSASRIEPVASGHGVERERRAVRGGPARSRTLRAGTAVQPHQDGDGLAVLARTARRAGCRRGTRRSAARVWAVRPTDFTWPRSTPYCWVGTDWTVRSTAASDGDGGARSRPVRTPSAYSGSSAWATFSTAATFAPVVTTAPMVAASAVSRPAATVRTTVSPSAVRTFSTGELAGSRLPSFGEHRGDLARDGALQDVTALAVGEDAGCAHGGGHRAGHRPHGGGGHRRPP